MTAKVRAKVSQVTPLNLLLISVRFLPSTDNYEDCDERVDLLSQYTGGKCTKILSKSVGCTFCLTWIVICDPRRESMSSLVRSDDWLGVSHTRGIV